MNDFFLSFEKLCFEIFMLPLCYINTLLATFSKRKSSLFWKICKGIISEKELDKDKETNNFRKYNFLNPYSFFFISVGWLYFVYSKLSEYSGAVPSSKTYSYFSLPLPTALLEFIISCAVFVFAYFISSLVILLVIKYLQGFFNRKFICVGNNLFLLCFWAYFFPFFIFSTISRDFLINDSDLFGKMYPHLMSPTVLHFLSFVVVGFFSIGLFFSPLLFVSSVSPSFFKDSRSNIVKFFKGLGVFLFIFVVIACGNFIYLKITPFFKPADSIYSLILEDMGKRTELIISDKNYCDACNFENYMGKGETFFKLLPVLNHGKESNKRLYHIAYATFNACTIYRRQFCNISKNDFDKQFRLLSDKFINHIFGFWIFSNFMKDAASFCENNKEDKFESACNSNGYLYDSFSSICKNQKMSKPQELSNICKTLKDNPIIITPYYFYDMYNLVIPAYGKLIQNDEYSKYLIEGLTKHFRMANSLLENSQF